MSPGIRLALAHIEANFTESIPMKDLAEIAGLCVWRFVTAFREQVGQTPHRFICRRRVQHAKELLREGVPSATVAMETGFFDQSHLYRHFKTICGVTPGQYLARIRAEVWSTTANQPAVERYSC
ncbi:MAG: AraC family transcriptional regulator [Roseiarcus sp.]|jgi:AraC-like DNA-binding protein